MTPEAFREALAPQDQMVFDRRIAVAPPEALRRVAPAAEVSPEYVRRIEMALRKRMADAGVTVEATPPPRPEPPEPGASFGEQVAAWLPHTPPTEAEVATRKKLLVHAHRHPPAWGISLAELADRVGMKRHTLVRTVAGRQSPRVSLALQLAAALGRVLVLWPARAPAPATPPPAMGVGAQVRAERVAQGLTQRWLAERAGLVQPWVCMVELGKVGGRLAHIHPLATALEVPLYLFPALASSASLSRSFTRKRTRT